VTHSPERGTTPRVALISDDPAAHDRIDTMIEKEGFHVCTYAGVEEFLHSSEGATADCLLLDLDFCPGLNALSAIDRERYSMPIIVISDQGDIPTAVAAIKAGAQDFVEKPFDRPEIIKRIEVALFDHRVPSQLGKRRMKDRYFPGSNTLTNREFDVLEQIVSGASNKLAGRVLGISPRTVEVHRARITEKVSARNTADLMRIVLS
jgi:two-component system, LuxR family, response regulator FixJ